MYSFIRIGIRPLQLSNRSIFRVASSTLHRVYAEHYVPCMFGVFMLTDIACSRKPEDKPRNRRSTRFGTLRFPPKSQSYIRMRWHEIHAALCHRSNQRQGFIHTPIDPIRHDIRWFLTQAPKHAFQTHIHSLAHTQILIISGGGEHISPNFLRVHRSSKRNSCVQRLLSIRQ